MIEELNCISKINYFSLQTTYEKETKMKSLNRLFSALQNGQKAKKHLIKIPKTRITCDILNILLSEGYICGFTYIQSEFAKNNLLKNNHKQKDEVQILLKYSNEEPVIKTIKQISSSGQRVYINSKKIKNLPSICFFILSTSKGIMTNKKAETLRVGGEIICRIV